MSDLPKYAHYKESGIEWLGEIPSHWKFISIKHLTQVKRGASPRPIDNPEYFDDNGEYAWVRIADVTNSNKYLIETTQRLSQFGSSFSVKLQPNSLFLSIAGSVGKPIITQIRVCIHDGFVYFPDWQHSIEFLYYIFESGQPYLGLGKLGTQLNLNTDTVGNIKIGLPSLKEQKAIVSFLDKKIAQIDMLISKQEMLLEKLTEQRIALISHTVTKGINPDVEMKESGVEWLGKIPDTWKIIAFHYISRLKSGEAITSLNFNSEGIYPVYGGNGFRGYIDKYNHDGNYILIGRQGALCGNINTVSGKFFASEHAIVVNPTKEFNLNWLYYLLNTMNLNQYSTSAAQPGLSAEVIGRLKIPFPSMSEQILISDYLDLVITKIKKIESSYIACIEKLKEYRSALITQAVTGKIDVRNLNQ